MRKRIYNWQGQRFGYIWLEGEPGQSLEEQSQGLFDRAGPELASLGLALDKNVVRTRVYGRTRRPSLVQNRFDRAISILQSRDHDTTLRTRRARVYTLDLTVSFHCSGPRRHRTGSTSR